MVEHSGRGHEPVGLVPRARPQDRSDAAPDLPDIAQGGGDVPQHAAPPQPHHQDRERRRREDHDRRRADVLPASYF